MNTLLKQKKEFYEKFFLGNDSLTDEVWNWIEKAIKEAREEGYQYGLRDGLQKQHDNTKAWQDLAVMAVKNTKQNKNELHNKIHKEGFEAGYKKGLKEAGEKTYTKQEVLESIEKAFWNGVEESESEGAGEYFSAEDYLPDTKQETGER